MVNEDPEFVLLLNPEPQALNLTVCVCIDICVRTSSLFSSTFHTKTLSLDPETLDPEAVVPGGHSAMSGGSQVFLPKWLQEYWGSVNSRLTLP